MSRDNFFAEHPMFKRAASSTESNSSEERLKNLVEFRDDIVFVWSEPDGALLAAKINSQEATYQTLRPITAPQFAVERLCVAAGAARACVWGARGALVLSLPARISGAGGALCKSVCPDERFVLSQAEVLRVRWHPDSLSHLLVLVSDNTIRLYNVALKGGCRLVRVLSIGPKPSARLAGRRLLETLGDTAVDFDAAPARAGGARLLVLRGNGDVYSVGADLAADGGAPARLCGPLAMYPPADDNYGEDSCSIAVLGGERTPPLVVIATCTAVLYHCLLLPDSGDSLDTTEEKVSSGLALYVVESVELSIVLGAEDSRQQYSCPVHLYPIPGKSDRYACAHAAGVHAVTLPLMSQLRDYAEADNSDIDGILLGLLSRPSVARYLLCTHGAAAGFRPPRGVCFLPPATLPAVLVWLPSGETVTRNLEPCNVEEQLFSGLQAPEPDLSFEHINSLFKEREKMSFSALVRELLTREVSQPLLRTGGGGEPSPKECLEFLTQSTSKLEEEYMRRQRQAAEVLRGKLRDVRALRRRQLDWFLEVQVEAEEATAKAAALRETCAHALKKQTDIRDRCWRLLRSAHGDAPATPAERAALAELQRDAERARQQTQRLQDMLDVKREQLKGWQDENERREMVLGRSHGDTITAVIQQQSEQISTLIEETKLLKDQLSIA